MRSNLVFYEPSPFRPLGLTYADLAREWYKWIQSTERDGNPVLDTNGRNCGLRQPELVWFLAGTAGTSVKRTCRIPAHKDVFVPIINEMSTSTQYKKRGQKLVNHCTGIIDQVFRKEIVFDGYSLSGSELDPYRVHTSLFTITLPKNNLCGVASGPTEAVCDGYWAMIRKEALSAGNHVLYFVGEQTDGFKTEVTYNLTISSSYRFSRLDR